MSGKSIDELQIRDSAFPAPKSTPTDPHDTDWYRFTTEIQDLLATGRYTFAQETLHAIAVTVEKTQRVTEGQRRAVRNIEESGLRPRRGFSRRYEGYGQ